MLHIVGISRRKPRRLPSRNFISTNLPRAILRLDPRNGRHLLPVLLYLESVPDAACGGRGGIGDVFEWEQGVERSSG